jgi:4-cresol dehydrogenase (hydroxylating)
LSTAKAAVNVLEAIAAWRELLGDEYVITAAETCRRVETATFPTSETIPAILRPANREQLQQCLRIANQFKTPLYPISCGKNWGYGSRVPVRDGCVVVALDRLKRILDFDEQLAYITVEPGVTFAEVNRYLRERGSDLVLNSPGSTPDASVIGNAVERGISGGLNGERSEQICNLEVVLPDGDCLQAGLDRFAGASAANVVRHGPGPGLDGLFLQSNLGIVTKLTLWLTPLPKFFQYFSFGIRTEQRLVELIDALRAVKREGLVETNVGLYNQYKLLTYITRHPGTRAGDERLSLKDLPGRDVDSLNSCRWFGEAAITAQNDEIGRAKRKLLKARLARATDQLVFAQEGGRNGLVGLELETSLASVYWRKPGLPDEELDPDRDRCGLIWIGTLTVFVGDSVRRCISLIEETMRGFPFEPIIGVQFHSPRAGRVITSVVYDRDMPGHDDQAMACHDEVLAVLNRNGFIPYRLSTRAMNSGAGGSRSYAELMKRIKTLFDPSGILAPGRYE